MRPQTLPCWRQAQADLRAAESAMNDGHFHIVSWLARQSSEKALKALYIDRHAQLAPRTHDLGFLGGLLLAPGAVQADLTMLAPTFSVVRYPDASGTAPVDLI